MASEKKLVLFFFLISSSYGLHMSSGVIDQDRKFMWHRRRPHSRTTSNTDGRLPSFEWLFTVHREVIGPALLILGLMLHTDSCYSKEWMIPKEIHHRHNYIYEYIYNYIYIYIYIQLNEEALDRTMWRNRFGRVFGPVVWQITHDDDDEDWYYIRTSLCRLIP